MTLCPAARQAAGWTLVAHATWAVQAEQTGQAGQAVAEGRCWKRPWHGCVVLVVAEACRGWCGASDRTCGSALWLDK